jgi:TetR/AcrR family transcriptional regulator, transcriptional repressor for nem operon
VEGNNYQKILSAAQNLVQIHGFNAFSYRDLSEAIGIKTSSIHYYFPSKNDLGETLVKEYRVNFQRALEQIESEYENPLNQLKEYVSLFLSTLKQGGKICLCGMLASDHQTLSEKIQSQVREFFDENEKWLAEILNKGKEQKLLGFAGNADDIAATFFAMLEGSMLVARVFNDENRLQKVADCWLNSLIQLKAS